MCSGTKEPLTPSPFAYAWEWPSNSYMQPTQVNSKLGGDSPTTVVANDGDGDDTCGSAGVPTIRPLARACGGQHVFREAKFPMCLGACFCELLGALARAIYRALSLSCSMLPNTTQSRWQNTLWLSCMPLSTCICFNTFASRMPISDFRHLSKLQQPGNWRACGLLVLLQGAQAVDSKVDWEVEVERGDAMTE